MKLTGRDAERFCAKPDLSLAGALIYGEDQAIAAERRARLVEAVLSADGGAAKDDLRLTRLAGADLRRDPALAIDAVRARGFFPGRMVVLIEGATDAASAAIEAAVDGATQEDAFIVAIAGVLRPSSSLRKLFEGARNLAAAPFYDDPPDRGAIADMAKRAGAPALDQGAAQVLSELAATMNRGVLSQLIARLAVHCADADLVTAQDVEDVSPGQADAAVDDVLAVVTTGLMGSVGPGVARLKAQGVTPSSLASALARRLRQLHQIACALERGASPADALKVLRPPPPWRMRDGLAAEARRWGSRRLESAMATVYETEAALRSSSPAPDYAVVERTLLRLAGGAPR